MTKEIPGMQKVLEFIECYKDHGLGTTGCKKLVAGDAAYPTEPLYNVQGSTEDKNHTPDYWGIKWKPLLEKNGILGPNCYVLPQIQDRSHFQFILGGHMKTGGSGPILPGGSCYLMPLCSLHNEHHQTGAFAYEQGPMLLLTGYLQGELLATFQLRLPSEEPYAILYYTEEGWAHQNLSKEQVMNLKTDFLPKINKGEEVNYVLFERVHEAQTMHYIREVNLPSSKS